MIKLFFLLSDIPVWQPYHIYTYINNITFCSAKINNVVQYNILHEY